MIYDLQVDAGSLTSRSAPGSGSFWRVPAGALAMSDRSRLRVPTCRHEGDALVDLSLLVVDWLGNPGRGVEALVQKVYRGIRQVQVDHDLRVWPKQVRQERGDAAHSERHRHGEPLFQSADGTIPMSRVGEADAIAGAAVLLASDGASFVNGIERLADGGPAQVQDRTGRT